MRSTPFSEQQYHELGEGSLVSARTVVPLVIDLLNPSSVVDFGSGTGAWLSVFTEHGCEVHGIEAGSTTDAQLLIPADRVTRADLEEPIDLGRRFDLAMSVEVAEHLPAEKAATLVESMTRHTDVVLFGAAIPGQGGVHHINEQWPDYWAELFVARGWSCFDPFRPVLWNDDSVEWWYRQNLLLFANRPIPGLTVGEPLSLVHPELWVRTLGELREAKTWQARTRGLRRSAAASLRLRGARSPHPE